MSRLALLAALLAGVTAVHAQESRGPRLGASTDFGQTWSPAVLAASRQLPLPVLRDEIFWKNVETADGAFVFDNPRTTYPDRLGPLGAELMFLVNNPHPAHDGGTTPRSPEGANAFARYTVETLHRFPGIKIVEIGNEMNSATFAWGPGWEGDLATRAASYARLLAATATAVRAARPDAEILGGAAHSIPIAWFREIFARGAADHMDALVIHPYTVRPEQLARQIALLRDEVPQTADLPLAVTEFGTKDADDAPAYLLKSYCQQAISGVTWSVWYPLNPRGDKLAALLTPEGAPTPTGRTFGFLRGLEGLLAEDIAPDPFTYGCRFGGSHMILWGEPRRVTLGEGVRAIDPATGRDIGAPVLSPDIPLVLTSKTGALRLGHEIRLGPSPIVADSWHQFAYPGASKGSDPFQRLVRQNGREKPLQMRPGQERGGVPWTPYLGTDIDGMARATAEWVLPSGTASGPIDIVTRYRAPHSVLLTPELRLTPWEGGATLSVLLNGDAILSPQNVTEGSLTLPPLRMAAGDALDVVIGPNGSGGGTNLRVILRADEP